MENEIIMNYKLRIQMSSCEGAVVRALGLIERRGFSLIKCAVAESDGMGRQMDVSVESSRPGDLLKRQLERLHDIHQVELLPTIVSNPQKPGVRPIARRV
jgi:acetolactate synthase II small subunit